MSHDELVSIAEKLGLETVWENLKVLLEIYQRGQEDESKRWMRVIEGAK